jgi:GAF domain-containing protein/HAMP domain-containing protein
MEPVMQLSNQETQITDRIKHALRVAIISFGAAVMAAGFHFYLAFQLEAWQMFALAAVIALFGVNTLVGVWLIRRHRPDQAQGLIIGGLFVIFPIASLLIAGLGLILGLCLILIVTTIVAQTLSHKWGGRAIVAGIVVGVFTFLLDYLGFDYRLEVPLLQTFVPIVTSLILLVYGYYIVRQFVHYSLQTKLIVAFLVVALIPMMALAYLADRSARQNMTDAANQRLSASTLAVKFSVEDFIDNNLEAASSQALLPDFVDRLSRGERANDARVRSILFSLNGRNLKYITSYGLLDSNGYNILDTSGSYIDSSEADEEYFRVPFELGEAYVSPVLFTGKVDELRPIAPTLDTTPDISLFGEEGEPEIIFSAPVRNLEGQILGVLRIRYRAQILQELLEQSIDIAGEGSFAVLFDENNLHLAHGIPERAAHVNYRLVTLPTDLNQLTPLWAAKRIPDVPVTELSTQLPELNRNLDNAASQPFFEATDVGDERINQVAVQFIEKYPTLPWRVAFFQPREVFLKTIETQTNLTLLLVIVIAGLVAVAAIGMARVLTAPIARLTTVVRRIAGGNLNERAMAESGDEIGLLANAFNRMTDQLSSLIGSLEEQVQERTDELALTIEVGQKASAIRKLDDLLPTITEFIRERFNLYYVHVYFVDDIGQNLIIKSGTGEVGRQLLARRHSLPIEQSSIVGRVAALGQPVVVSDTEHSDIHRPNLLLPFTRSELAVPLKVEERVIGVLDMQANTVNTFTLNNLPVFEAMATQLAISIDSAQQWATAQEAQERTDQALKQFTRQAWRQTLAMRSGRLGYRYDLSNVMPLESRALESASGEPNGGLSVPVTMQNEPIGQLHVKIPEGRHWTADEQAFIEAVAQQLAQKAENLRLFDETQRQATREQVTRQIADKIRASRNIETALKTAAEELSKALGTTTAIVDLRAAAPDDNDTQELPESS